MKKLLALTLAAVFVLCLAACGAKNDTPAETQPETEEEYLDDTPIDSEGEKNIVTGEDESQKPADVSEVSSADTTAPQQQEGASEGSSEAATVATTEAEETFKNPETKEEIVEFYKAAATKTNKGKINANDQMTLVSLNGGSGAVGKLIDLFEPIAKKALAKNSGSVDHVTGGFEKLTADDVASATAKTSADGRYTTVRINLKEQTDGMNGKSKEGHVGHGVSILDGVQKAIDELDGIQVDASGGSIKLHYNKAYIDCKIDNKTGKIVSGTWHYTVNVSINNVRAKISILPWTTLNGASGVVDYKVTL